MNSEPAGSVTMVLDALGQGLPLLLTQFLLTLVLLGVGVAVYMTTTPFRERELVRQGNTAAATLLGGTVIALAVPLAALLATSARLLDILVWGVIALVLQLLTFAVVSQVVRGTRAMIEAGNVATAIVLVSAQLAVALLNAAAMVPV